MVHFEEPISIANFGAWYADNIEKIEECVLRTGALVFQGIALEDDKAFSVLVDLINPVIFDYVDGNSPRTKLGEKIYTSTEYDKTQRITMHNELSYASRWPSKLFFACIEPAISGGETPLADSRIILEKMPAEIVDEIKRKKIRYIRNLHGGFGVGPSWQDTFETHSRADVESYCTARHTQFFWKDDGALQLVQLSDGIHTHPKTGEKVWFNQIDQFHPVHLSPEIYDGLLTIFGSEDNLPMYVTYGDGTRISEDTVLQIQKTIDSLLVIRPWAQGDLVLIDNVLVCHGRMPFTGKRKILVSMG